MESKLRKYIEMLQNQHKGYEKKIHDLNELLVASKTSIDKLHKWCADLNQELEKNANLFLNRGF